MITKERIAELESMFWSETNEPWTTDWREELTDEEDELIFEWDEQVSRGFRNLILEIHRLQELRKNREE
ncbi:MAG: hypothetical protein FWH01_15970 [Oscillospiraceae bacterium]|nr:hypothetical protein [Oscillospiraceae bacterium]